MFTVEATKVSIVWGGKVISVDGVMCHHGNTLQSNLQVN